MNDTVFANDVQNVIKSVAESNDIQKYKLSAIETNDKGEGFLGKIFMVTISDRVSDRKIDLLMKFAFKDEKIRESVPIRQSFENEIYFYSTVYPALDEFRKSAGCPKQYTLIPKCYQTSLKTEMEGLVLENLKSEGFEVFDKKLVLTDSHVELIFQRYGYFHAHSLALKDQDYQKFSELVAPMKNIYQSFLDTEMFRIHTKVMMEEVNKIFVPGRDDKLIESFRKYVEKACEIFQDSVDDGGEYSTILHGDCWSNNMLFKYDKKSGRATDIRLIDWQLVKPGSPVCDLSYAFYSSGVSKSNLDKLDDYLRIYHDSLSSTLQKLGSVPDQILTFKQLKEQWKIYAKFGFIMGVMVVRTKCTYSEDMLDLSDIDYDNLENLEKFKETRYDSEKYEKTMYDLTSHMLEIGAM